MTEKTGIGPLEEAFHESLIGTTRMAANFSREELRRISNTAVYKAQQLASQLAGKKSPATIKNAFDALQCSMISLGVLAVLMHREGLLTQTPDPSTEPCNN